MDSELIKRARAVMQGVPAKPSVKAPAVIEEQPPVVSAQSILAEHDEAEVARIVEVWRRLFGFSESREHIDAGLRSLRRWATGAKKAGTASEMNQQIKISAKGEKHG